MYVPLRTHGWHTLLAGVDPPERLLEAASRLGLAALALTDVDTLAGSTDFLLAARRAGGRGARPLLGAELSDPGGAPGRLVALVRDATGYRNLCKLVSARRLGDDPGRPHARLGGPETFRLIEAAVRFREGLLFLADHPRLLFALAEELTAEQLFVAVSPVSLARSGSAPSRRRARPGAADAARAEADAAAELDAHKTPPPSPVVPARTLVESARALGLAVLAVPDVYWLAQDGHEHHRVRTAIKHNALRCALPEAWLVPCPAHLPSAAELCALYADLPDVPGRLSRARADHPGALLRTLEVADACRFTPPLGGVLFPEVDLEPGETPYSRLCRLAFEGAQHRFRPLRPEVVRRLDHELAAIEKLGFAPYFLLVRKIADFACAEGIPHVGRGSAADSLVAYCLELTDADPLRYKLPFERFLNPARSDRPDIDLDFSWRRRDDVLEHVWKAFGTERTAMIATLNRFGLRAAFREAALAEGIPPVEVNRWSRRLPWAVPGADAGEAPHDGSADGTALAEEEPSRGVRRVEEPPGRIPADGAAGSRADTDAPPARPLPRALRANPVARALAAAPECRGFPFADERWRFVLRIAGQLVNTPRHLGLHPGGVVVAPGPITDVVSCQRATKGVVMTQLDKDGVEALGLVKMDLLGNRALTVIEDCLEGIRAAGDTPPDLRAISEEDPRTRTLLARGATLGCFQVESPGMRNLLQQTASRSMDDVIQAVALIRPGPAGSGMKDAYVRRFRGLEEPHPPHPRLTELLWETHGVMLYQEDVMQAVVLLAGLDLATADELRRALAKRREDRLAPLRARFFAGCEREGIASADTRRVWELIENFSSFGFCKAHAVTYGQISYRTVYLKAHHPAAYLTAFLNSQTGYYEARVYVEEARRLGVDILGPDVNRSGAEFSLEPRRDAAPALRVGLGRVHGLTAATMQAILERRDADGPFLSLPDFLRRTGARVDETRHLIQCGAFDAFDRTRPEMLWRLHLFSTPERRVPRDLVRELGPLDPGLLAACRTAPDQRAGPAPGSWSAGSLGPTADALRPGGTASLFPAPETPGVALPALPDTDARTRGTLELDLLGLTLHAHPSELFPCAGDEARLRWPTIRCADVAAHAGHRVHVRGWLAASRRVHTSDGRWMRFLTLEDTSGLAEVVLFADAYERDGHRLTSRGPFRILGTVEDHLGACTLHAERIL